MRKESSIGELKTHTSFTQIEHNPFEELAGLGCSKGALELHNSYQVKTYFHGAKDVPSGLEILKQQAEGALDPDDYTKFCNHHVKKITEESVAKPPIGKKLLPMVVEKKLQRFLEVARDNGWPEMIESIKNKIETAKAEKQPLAFSGPSEDELKKLLTKAQEKKSALNKAFDIFKNQQEEDKVNRNQSKPSSLLF